MDKKYWWLLGGIVIGIGAAPLLRRTPVIGAVVSKIPTV